MPAASEHRRGARAERDPRLDVFRGLGMFIILVAHVPANAVAEWIPARFGFSDATEIFVFCSGMASALAFGRAFDRAGLGLGTLRIGHRIWQVYWAHVGVFVATVATLAFADSRLPDTNYLRDLFELGPFLDSPGPHLFGLLTLTYVPNRFDILPMYLGILALLPIAMVAERVRGPALVGALSLGLWLLAFLGGLDLPSDLSGHGWTWFFNPFSWQLLFFLGFGFARGWLRPPPRDRRLVLLALAVLAASAPFSCHPGWACHAGWGAVPWLGEVHAWLGPAIGKTHLGPLRVLHFAALAYLAFLAAGARGATLRAAGGFPLVALVGRQTLAVFLFGLWLAPVLGVLLDLVGRDAVTAILANLAGGVGLVAVAALAERIKAAPWNAPRRTPADAAADPRPLAATSGAERALEASATR